MSIKWTIHDLLPYWQGNVKIKSDNGPWVTMIQAEPGRVATDTPEPAKTLDEQIPFGKPAIDMGCHAGEEKPATTMYTDAGKPPWTARELELVAKLRKARGQRNAAASRLNVQEQIHNDCVRMWKRVAESFNSKLADAEKRAGKPIVVTLKHLGNKPFRVIGTSHIPIQGKSWAASCEVDEGFVLEEVLDGKGVAR